MQKYRKTNGEDETVEFLPSNYPPMEFGQSSSTQVEVELAAASHRGLVRVNNEDHYLALRFGRSLETLFTNLAEGLMEPGFDETGYGMLVADGIGGMAGGEVASRTALCRLIELGVSTPDWMMNLSRDENALIVQQRMIERFRQVDDTLREQAQNNRSLAGMGTTLTVAVSLGSQALIGHIGDSRAYLLRGSKLHQLTRDHTLAQAMIDAGIANPEDAATRAMRHVLTAALGSTGEPVNPQIQRLNISGDDQILLCTDGLTEMVKEEVIASVLRKGKTANEACRDLIDLALNAGGSDNVTVVLARYRFPN